VKNIELNGKNEEFLSLVFRMRFWVFKILDRDFEAFYFIKSKLFKLFLCSKKYSKINETLQIMEANEQFIPDF
jgi:hypothetical protein